MKFFLLVLWNTFFFSLYAISKIKSQISSWKGKNRYHLYHSIWNYFRILLFLWALDKTAFSMCQRVKLPCMIMHVRTHLSLWKARPSLALSSGHGSLLAQKTRREKKKNTWNKCAMYMKNNKLRKLKSSTIMLYINIFPTLINLIDNWPIDINLLMQNELLNIDGQHFCKHL